MHIHLCNGRGVAASAPLLVPFISIHPFDAQRRVAYIYFFPYSLLYLLHLRNGCQTGGAPSSSSLAPFFFSHTHTHSQDAYLGAAPWLGFCLPEL
jgi:hypothetical protein